ncbi:MAG: hypothetical protein ACRD1R_00580 [Acidobacteriota bacterium]
MPTTDRAVDAPFASCPQLLCAWLKADRKVPVLEIWVILFTIEFFRCREGDDAHATLDRITQIGTDLEAVKVKAKSLFETLNMPQKPDGLRILDQDGDEVFVWTPGADDA